MMIRKLLLKRDINAKPLLLSFTCVWFVLINIYFFIDLLINRRIQIANLFEYITGF